MTHIIKKTKVKYTKEYLDNSILQFTEANMWEFALDYGERFRFDFMLGVDLIKADEFLSENIEKFKKPQ